MRTLVLNVTYEPLSVVAGRRAVVLLLHGRVDVVEPSAQSMRTPTSEVVVPSVVRIRRYVKVPRYRSIPLTRRTVFARDEGRCQYCGGPAECIDHVLPRSRGGVHSWDNVVAACHACNTAKADRLLDETPLLLTRPPGRPGHWVTALGTADPRWMPYLAAV